MLFITSLSATSLFICVLFNAFYPIDLMLLVKRSVFSARCFVFLTEHASATWCTVFRSSPICLYGHWMSSLGMSLSLALLHFIDVSLQIDITFVYCICQHEWYDGVELFLEVLLHTAISSMNFPFISLFVWWMISTLLLVMRWLNLIEMIGNLWSCSEW